MRKRHHRCTVLSHRLERSVIITQHEPINYEASFSFGFCSIAIVWLGYLGETPCIRGPTP